jgi:hypothetical protein
VVEDQDLLLVLVQEAALEEAAQVQSQATTAAMEQPTVALVVAVVQVLTHQVVVQAAEVDQVLLL